MTHTHTEFSVKIPMTNRSHMCVKFSGLHHHSLYATTLVSRYVVHLQKDISRVLCCAKVLTITVSSLMWQPLTLLLFDWQVSFPPLVFRLICRLIDGSRCNVFARAGFFCRCAVWFFILGRTRQEFNVGYIWINLGLGIKTRVMSSRK